MQRLSGSSGPHHGLDDHKVVKHDLDEEDAEPEAHELEPLAPPVISELGGIQIQIRLE